MRTEEVHYAGRVVEVKVTMQLPVGSMETHRSTLERLGENAGYDVVHAFEGHGYTIREAEVVTTLTNLRHRIVSQIRRPKVIKLKKSS